MTLLEKKSSHTRGTSIGKSQLLRAISTIYLALPTLLFAWGWLRWPFALITTLLLIAFILTVLMDIVQSIQAWPRFVKNVNQDRPPKYFLWIGLSFLMLILWLLFSGTGGFGFQNADFQVSNSLLKELILQDWPLTLSANEVKIPYVYYVGYYLPAAAAGKLFGWNIANLFQFIWTLCGASLGLAWFIRLTRVELKEKPSRILCLSALFILVGGLDFIGAYVLKGDIFKVDKHLEVWAIFFQYSSNTALIYWVPQHTLAAWLITGMLVDSLYNHQDLKYLGIALSTSILWSPFGVAGLLPYLMILLLLCLSSRARYCLHSRTAMLLNLSSLWIGSIHLLYLASNQFKFPTGLIWENVHDRLRLFKYLFAFWSLEYGFLAILIMSLMALSIFATHRAGQRKSTTIKLAWKHLLMQQFNIEAPQFELFILSLAILTVLPLFKVGANNDLVMRGSIPSLFVFWAFVVKIIIDAIPHVKRKWFLLYALTLTVVVIGFAPAVAEMTRSIKNYQLGPPPISSVIDTEDLSRRDLEQRSGSPDSFFFRFLAKEAPVDD
jgi:hypothetical protein